MDVATTQPAGKPQSSAKWADLSHRLDSLDLRVEELDKTVNTKTKTLREKAAEWGAFVGLMLSLPLALFTLYGKLLSEPADQQRQLEKDVIEIVSRIQGINQKIQAIAFSTQDDASKGYQFSVLGAEKAPLVESAKVMVGELRKPTISTVYSLMSAEAANVGDWDMARTYADAAVKAPGSNYIKSEALRSRAGLRVMTEGPSALGKAQKDIDEAVKLLAGYPAAAKASPIATLEGTWIGIRVNAGDCTNLDGLVRHFLAAARNPLIVKPQQDVLVANLAFTLRGQNRCPFDPASVGIPTGLPAPAAAAPVPNVPILPGQQTGKAPMAVLAPER